MKIVQGFLVLLLVSAFFIGAIPTAWAADSWVTDPKTGCKIVWVFDNYTIVAVSWSGPAVDNLAEGKGALTFTIRGKDGKELRGQGDVEMKAGKLDGKGSIKWSNGQVSDGDYKNGRMNGKGVIKFSNGETYDGDFKDGDMEGRGVYKKVDGSTYDGEWKRSVKEGKGIVKWANGESYDGDFKNGKMDGRGIIKGVNGTVYEGDVLEGKPAGYGVLKDASGKVLFEGESTGPSDDSGQQF